MGCVHGGGEGEHGVLWTEEGGIAGLVWSWREVVCRYSSLRTDFERGKQRDTDLWLSPRFTGMESGCTPPLLPKALGLQRGSRKGARAEPMPGCSLSYTQTPKT